MLVVRVELHSAITNKVTDLGTMVIDNVGGTSSRGNYRTRTYRKGTINRFVSFIQPAPLWQLVRKATVAQRQANLENYDVAH